MRLSLPEDRWNLTVILWPMVAMEKFKYLHLLYCIEKETKPGQTSNPGILRQGMTLSSETVSK